MNLGEIKIKLIESGNFWSDGGAAMGVLPKTIWNKKVKTDNKNRIRLNLNLLLIRYKNQNILIDTGIGNKLTEKEKKIYKPSNFSLLEKLQNRGVNRTDVDYVILTHLHFDHAGGIVTNFNGNYELTFPNAEHLIQKDEWKIAKNPDILNKAAYNFKDNLSLLDKSPKLHLIDGDFKLKPGIRLIKTGGHTNGMQIVRIQKENKLIYYPGDIISSKFHLILPVTSAYDVSRYDTFVAKKQIINEVKKNNGSIILNHETGEKIVSADEI